MAEKEYIERGALLERLKKTPRYFDVKFDVLEAPAADVVEVVRCKDCKHYEQNPWNKETELLCQCYSDWNATEPDDFCSCGERKSEI